MHSTHPILLASVVSSIKQQVFYIAVACALKMAIFVSIVLQMESANEVPLIFSVISSKNENGFHEFGIF